MHTNTGTNTGGWEGGMDLSELVSQSRMDAESEDMLLNRTNLHSRFTRNMLAQVSLEVVVPSTADRKQLADAYVHLFSHAEFAVADESGNSGTFTTPRHPTTHFSVFVSIQFLSPHCCSCTHNSPFHPPLSPNRWRPKVRQHWAYEHLQHVCAAPGARGRWLLRVGDSALPVAHHLARFLRSVDIARAADGAVVLGSSNASSPAAWTTLDPALGYLASPDAVARMCRALDAPHPARGEWHYYSETMLLATLARAARVTMLDAPMLFVGVLPASQEFRPFEDTALVVNGLSAQGVFNTGLVVYDFMRAADVAPLCNV